MLGRIPEVEAERIQREVRKEENLVLAAIRKNLGEKWREKDEIIKRRTSKSKMAARRPQDGQRGLKRCLPLDFGAFLVTFAK